MRVVFDPALDGPIWRGPFAATAGEAWLGPLGLLDRLETELGLGGAWAPAAERACALAALLAGRSGWWRASYEADPIGTAARMLADRDALVMGGWRGEPAGARLDELWAATAGATAGPADRLRAVHDALAGRRADVGVVRLAPVTATAALWEGVFERLGAETVELPRGGGGEVSLYRAHGPLAAADELAATLAAQPSLEGVVFVGGDATLDAALHRHGLPRLGLDAPAPASAALIRLVVEAAFTPMEPDDLHALLCLDPGPVPRGRARPLVAALAEYPGRGSAAWKGALGEDARLAGWLMPSAPRDGRIAAAEIDRRLIALAGWAFGRELGAVARLATSARRLIATTGRAELSLVELRRICDELRASGEAEAEAGLAAVVQAGAVLAPAETVIWWSFTRASAPPAPRVRLAPAELAALAAHGVAPPSPTAWMEDEAARWRRPLDQATRALLLVCPDTDEAGERQFPHPLWDEIGAGRAPTDRLRWPVAAIRRVAAARPLPVFTTTVRTGAPIALRETESPSSLERLLGCSLSWALNYPGGLRPGLSAGPLQPSGMLYGKLAHQLLATLFTESAAPAPARVAALLDEELGALCESLALPRWQVERTMVAQTVADAARELTAFLAATGATIRGAELEASGVLEGIGAGGRADLVLDAPDVILDFKWGRGNRQYDQMAAGAALQLAVYHQLFGARHDVAYFILGRQQLIGQPGSRLPNVRIPGRATAADTWRGAAASLARRRGELAAGVLHAPGADVGADEIDSRLEAGGLVIEPGCVYCAFAGICGRGAAR